jgi:hypothetical protein
MTASNGLPAPSCLLLPALAVALLAGCGAPPSGLPPGSLTPTYRTTSAPYRVDGSARVETSFALAPELRPVWEIWFSKGPEVDARLHGLAEALANDVASSGLFARIQPAGPEKTDYVVRVQGRQFMQGQDIHMEMVIQLLDGASSTELFKRNAALPLGLASGPRGSISFTRQPSFPPDMPDGWSGSSLLVGGLLAGFEQVMPVLKAGVAGYFQSIAERAAMDRLQGASLPELVKGLDQSVAMARERNRAIIVAKNQQLPVFLRERKTDELTGLVIVLEQAILDLDHESELAKDRAQQAAASGASGQTNDLRSLSISYRERIELLKPILAVLKEEIANRNR